MATCSECDGRGEVTCFHCYGSGRHGSNPKKPCAYCEGKKLQDCHKCNGTGKT